MKNIINPLRKEQIKKLEAIGFDDLARKINELAEEVTKIKAQCFFGKEMTVNVCNGKEVTAKHATRTYGIYDCPEEGQLHKDERIIARGIAYTGEISDYETKAKKDLLKRMIKRSKNEGALSVIKSEYNKLK